MRTCSTSSADVLKQTQIYTVEGEERDLQEYIFVELTGETMLVRCRYWVEYVCVCARQACKFKTDLLWIFYSYQMYPDVIKRICSIDPISRIYTLKFIKLH